MNSKSKQQKADIFISYARSTGRVMAGRINDALRNLNYTVHMDTHNGENGKNTKKEKEDVIKNCKDFILILSANTVDNNGNEHPVFERKWVAREICWAIKYNKNIVVIKMDDFHFLKDENGNNKDLDPPKEILEEFDENVLAKLREIPHTNLVTGIDFREETSDYALKALRKKLKSKPKWKLKKKIIIFSSTFIILFSIAIISKMRYNKQLPIFSLALLNKDGHKPTDDDLSWNFQYILSNKGGELASGVVIPKIYLSLKIVSKVGGWDYRTGDYKVGFTGFYDKGYSFDDKNNTVTIFEKDADLILMYMGAIENYLEKKDMRISMYAVQTMFEIDYYDCFGLHHTDYYDCENNYNYYSTPWDTTDEAKNQQDNTEIDESTDDFIRSYTDTTLIKTQKFDGSNVDEEIPLSKIYLAFDSKSTAKYIIKHKNSILKTNVISLLENDNKKGFMAYKIGEASYPLYDTNGLVIGFHSKHQRCKQAADDKTIFDKLVDFFNDLF